MTAQNFHKYFNSRYVNFLLAGILLLIGIPLTVSLTTKVRDDRGRAAVTNGQDLDVTYIERTPRYQRYNVVYPNGYPTLASGTENLQRNPNPGDTVTFTAHFKNAGTVASNSFAYKWYIDGVQTQSGNHNGLAIGAADFVSFQWVWQSGDHQIKFSIDPGTGVTEISAANNQLQDWTNAAYLRMQVEQTVYNNFNAQFNLVGSYSYEDWLQAQMAALNQKLIDSGSKQRVRIDQITVQADNTLPVCCTHADINWDWDGSWGFSLSEWCMPTTCPNLTGNQDDITYWATRVQPSLVHEWSHQLGMAHSYDANIDIATNNQITSQSLVQSNPDIVGTGGDDVGNAFDNNVNFTPYFINAMGSNVGFRRGYYADYLFDVPDTNILNFKNALGSPLVNASLKIWQSANNALSGNPRFTGVTDANGNFTLPNQALPLGNITTATGHTLKPNPFGAIDVNGHNGLFLIGITFNGQTEYKFLTVHDFNLAYWRGSKTTATLTLNTSLLLNSNPTNIALNKSTSSYCNSSCAGPSAAAVDGDKTSITTGYWSPISENGTKGDWWKIDLGSTHNIYKVIVYSGARNNHDWYSQFHIEASATGQFSGEQKTVATETNWDLSRQNTQSVTYLFNSPSTRYLRIVSDITQNFIRLQEVEVFEYSSKIGDTNSDNLVNSADLAQLLSTWGSASNLTADFNGDGRVDSADLAILLAHWGS